MVVMVVLLRDWVGYDIIPNINKSKYKIGNYFMANTLIFQCLYINILNYRYFHTDCSTFKKSKIVRKIKKC